MSHQDEEVRNFISTLGEIGDTRAFSAAFEKIIRKFRYKYFVISAIPNDGNIIEDLLVVHNLPEGWVHEYISKNFIIDDPIARHCKHSPDPFYWREAIDATTSREAKEIMSRAESFGLTNGVCFPIHDINGYEAGVSLSGSVSPLKQTDIRSLYLASIMAFNTLRRIRSDHSVRIESVSERESEVLTWCALGRTSKEIAHILFVSENTVNVHIKNAINKLSAKNKTEAVAIAARKGIISI